LQSRYYSPEWGRFINADGYVQTPTGVLGTNMFAYCNNNPVLRYDPTGRWSESVHKNITNYHSLNSLITNIIKKYGFTATKSLIDTAKDALLRGSIEPDKDFKKYSADNGWHGVWNGWHHNGKYINNRLSELYTNAHNDMKNAKVANAFFKLGMGLHTIQDTTAHFMYGPFNLHTPFCSKGDSLKWDYIYTTTNLGNTIVYIWKWNELRTSTVSGNRRARVAADYSYYYLYYFYTAKGTNFVKYNFTTSGIYDVFRTYK